jgi:hypothetical protein
MGHVGDIQKIINNALAMSGNEVLNKPIGHRYPNAMLRSSRIKNVISKATNTTEH